MHSRNLHKHGYDFAALSKTYPALVGFLRLSTKGKTSIDFANPQAVKCLNAALLSHHYSTTYWDIPDGYLCPAVPGRADYIHHIADLLVSGIDSPKRIKGLDIGTGANLIYPIVGSQIYGWDFVASDIDNVSFQSAKTIATSNPTLKKRIKVKHQTEKTQYFAGIVGDEAFDFSMCNPPFHSSKQQAMEGNIRKLKGLKHNQNKRNPKVGRCYKNEAQGKAPNQALNFGGQSNELWCQGGELAFVTGMIKESLQFAQQIKWFTCLISKQANVAPLLKQIEKQSVSEAKTVTMQQGNKTSRFIAWRY